MLVLRRCGAYLLGVVLKEPQSKQAQGHAREMWGKVMPLWRLLWKTKLPNFGVASDQENAFPKAVAEFMEAVVDLYIALKYVFWVFAVASY